MVRATLAFMAWMLSYACQGANRRAPSRSCKTPILKPSSAATPAAATH